MEAQIAHQDVAAGDAMTSVLPFQYPNRKKIWSYRKGHRALVQPSLKNF